MIITLLEENKVLCHKAILICLLFLLYPVYSFAQQPILQKTITVHADNLPVHEVLNKINASAGIRLSYNSELIDENKRISIHFDNAPVNKVLKKVFEDYLFEFKEMNGQVIIYQKRKVVDKSSSGTLRSKGSITKIITIYDTIITTQHDTIVHMRFDTLKVYKYDTISVFDTIIKIEELPFRKNFKSSIGFNFSPRYYNFFSYPFPNKRFPADESMQELNNTFQEAISFGLEYRLTYRNAFFNSGINYTRFDDYVKYHLHEYQVNFDSILSLVPVYDSTTIEDFYLHANGTGGFDTVFVSETRVFVDRIDSLYNVSTDTVTLDNEGSFVNRYKIIEVPFLFGHEFDIGQDFHLALIGGVTTAFVKQKSINSFILEDGNYVTSSLKDDELNVFFSFQALALLEYDINSNIAIHAGLNYKKSFTPVFTQNYLVAPEISSLAIQLGARYKF